MKKFLSISTLSIFFSLSIISAQAAGEWQSGVDSAIRNNDYNQINIIGASNPTATGQIALYLLGLSQNGNNPMGTNARIFDAAAPFSGQITPADAPKATSAIATMLSKASDPAFQDAHPHDAAMIFTAALVMSGQPNIVVQDPNLHQEVLTAADAFVKKHPDDADKRLEDEVSLAEAGGAPNNQPLVMPNVSQ